jgi:hypothetical protein
MAEGSLTGVQTQDTPGGTLEYTENVTVPACPIYQGKNWATGYVMNKLDAGNTGGVGPGGCTVCAPAHLVHGVTKGNGLWLIDSGAVSHYVFAWQLDLPQGAPTVGLDPYLRWLGGTASVANDNYYYTMHNMFGVIEPTYGLHFSAATPGVPCPEPFSGYCQAPSHSGSTTDPYETGWYLASQWQYWPSPTTYWVAACLNYIAIAINGCSNNTVGTDVAHPATLGRAAPKIVVDFESHIPTVQGTPLLLQLTGKMQAAWFYNHFGLNLSTQFATPEGTLPNWTFPAGTTTTSSTSTSVSTAPSPLPSCPGGWISNGDGGQICDPNASTQETVQNGTLTTQTTVVTTSAVNGTLPFEYPSGITANIYPTSFVPGAVHESNPFPVTATAHIRINYVHLVEP